MKIQFSPMAPALSIILTGTRHAIDLRCKYEVACPLGYRNRRRARKAAKKSQGDQQADDAPMKKGL